MRAAVVFLAILPALSACSLIWPEDKRVGTESAADCAARVSGLLGPGSDFRRYEGEVGVPTYTYDITKLALDDVQALVGRGGDETAGYRTMNRTNMTDTAVEEFMARDVDEKGAFFLGRDPALYRVRGERQPVSDMIANGCARQQADMRLIDVQAGPAPQDPAADREPEQETQR
ncbi:hypothetical protein [Erythrobacter sp. HL-111]|uniref:hypothetical protein n=1 Tax=Erythrobacter sp. HL-111 TaxID=1798193 RepID=UPI0006DB6C51|nr:hypothetical protein [Erythrobacter sp. HL-111]KPP93234.1 MAG: hypothetical protein HLUCCO15_06770 [Erythrobacteraceae bacterium HL-111]SDR90786.1 hypothetical protein SAMN04515621_0609 [Erythrobacter sp. HL-111]